MDLNSLQQKINNYTTVVSSWVRNVGKLYFDSTPQNVSVELLDDNGNVATTTMPNLAKTRADFEAWKQSLFVTNQVTINQISVSANTPTLFYNLKELGLTSGIYILTATWIKVRDNVGTDLIWYGGASGIIYFNDAYNYNASAAETLVLNFTSHFRTIPYPVFTIDSIPNSSSSGSNYGDYGLYVTFDRDVVANNVTVKLTKIGV